MPITLPNEIILKIAETALEPEDGSQEVVDGHQERRETIRAFWRTNRLLCDLARKITFSSITVRIFVDVRDIERLKQDAVVLTESGVSRHIKYLSIQLRDAKVPASSFVDTYVEDTRINDAPRYKAQSLATSIMRACYRVQSITLIFANDNHTFYNFIANTLASIRFRNLRVLTVRVREKFESLEPLWKRRGCGVNDMMGDNLSQLEIFFFICSEGAMDPTALRGFERLLSSLIHLQHLELSGVDCVPDEDTGVTDNATEIELPKRCFQVSAISPLSKLTKLSVRVMSLTGTISQILSRFPNLAFLEVVDCQLTGEDGGRWGDVLDACAQLPKLDYVRFKMLGYHTTQGDCGVGYTGNHFLQFICTSFQEDEKAFARFLTLSKLRGWYNRSADDDEREWRLCHH